MLHGKFARTLSTISAVFILSASVLVMDGCVPPSYSRNQHNAGPKNPGLYGLTGWNGYGSDVNGEVGHPLTVGGPTANCVPSRNWTANARIASGELPPGITLNDAPWTISGLPTERGHWIVKIELYNVTCGGNSYQGITQELRFHITGSGKVVQ